MAYYPDKTLDIPKPSPKQIQFLTSRKKFVGYGGARGGGKSWAIRTKATILCAKHCGIKVCIVRKTYPELKLNHINDLQRDLEPSFARYNDKYKILKWRNGSSIQFQYCAKDKDLDNFQGAEYDVIFIDEATQLSEHQLRAIVACCRGTNGFPKHVYFTCNPGGQGHGYIKRLFIDRKYEKGENPDDYEFIQALVTDNEALMRNQPDYVQQLDALPPKLRDAWRFGSWDIFEGQFFEEFTDNSDGYISRRYTHVIEDIEYIPEGWSIYRSFDFGYSKPFSCDWYAIDYEGRAYLFKQFYGVRISPDGTLMPNEGLKKPPDWIFSQIRKQEEEDPRLHGRVIHGVADPSIWDCSRGEAIVESADRAGIYFEKGDNARIPGWMQVHYRLAFDHSGKPMLYFCKSCRDAIRTLPLMTYSETKVEDLNTDLEDHFCDSLRYFCMARKIKPTEKSEDIEDDTSGADPLDLSRKSRGWWSER